MQKIIYTTSSLILLATLVFGGLYFNGNYNDKSQTSTTLQENKVANKKEEGEKTGTFNRIDPAHYASGDVKISSDENYYYINFQDNFISANGPDLYVYLSSEQEYKNIAIGGIDTSKTLNIGN